MSARPSADSEPERPGEIAVGNDPWAMRGWLANFAYQHEPAFEALGIDNAVLHEAARIADLAACSPASNGKSPTAVCATATYVACCRCGATAGTQARLSTLFSVSRATISNNHDWVKAAIEPELCDGPTEAA